MHELILLEIIAVPAERSRGRHNPRVVKRKMSSFPTKARATPAPSQVFRYAEHIRVVAPPVSSPADRVPPPAALMPDRQGADPGRLQRRPATHPGWSMSAPGGPAACRVLPTASATA